MSVLLAVLGAAVSPLAAQNTAPEPVYRWTTLAGRASSGLEDGPAADARFNNPQGLARDAAGNLYVADAGNHAIRRISPQGVVTTVAGNPGVAGHADGTGANARFRAPQGVAIDFNGNLYVADAGNFVIRRITPAGEVTTLAGQPGQRGSADGTAANARFRHLRRIGVDDAGTVHVLDQGLRRIANGSVTTVLTGVDGEEIGPWDELAVTRIGEVYFTTNDGGTIRRRSTGGVVRTVLVARQGASQPGIPRIGGTVGPMFIDAGGVLNFAGQDSPHDSRCYFYRLDVNQENWLDRASRPIPAPDGGPGFPSALVRDALGRLLYTQSADHAIMALDGDEFRVHAGTAWSASGAEGQGHAARFAGIAGLTVDATGAVLAADAPVTVVNGAQHGPARLYAITPAGESRVLHSEPAGTSTRRVPLGVAVDSARNAVLATRDLFTNLTRVDAHGGVTHLLRGSFFHATSVAFDGAGRLLVADIDQRIHRRDTQGNWTVLAGANGIRGIRDGLGDDARFSDPVSLVVAKNGDAYILDYGYQDGRVHECFIRRIEPNGRVTTVSGNLARHATVDGLLEVTAPHRLAVTSQDDFVLSYFTNQTIVLLSGGREVVIGGRNDQLGSRDGNGTEALFHFPQGVAVDGQDAIYVADAWGTTIRKGERAGTKALILKHPENATIRSGESVQFSVTAISHPEPSFQWHVNGIPLNGATASTLSLGSVAPSQSGSYSVTVKNEFGSVTSNPATLTVTESPPPPAGGGGGGGAPSPAFLAALLALAAARARRRRTSP